MGEPLRRSVSPLSSPCSGPRGRSFEWSLTGVPPVSERIGGGDDDSIRSQTWDGRGPEPQRNKPLGGSRRPQRHTLAPWDDYVDEDEVEGGAGEDGLYRTESRRFRDNNDDLLGRDNDSPSAGRRTEPEFDPLTNEQFYPAPQVAPIRPTATGGGSKKKFGSGLFKHRSRYAEQPFDTTDAVSSRTRGSDADGYQDEFEREINEEAVAHHRTGNGNGMAAGSGARFDTFEAEGPEDAWAAPVPAAVPAVSDGYKYGNGYAAAQPVRPQRTGRAEETDGDCESRILPDVARLELESLASDHLARAPLQCSITPSKLDRSSAPSVLSWRDHSPP